LKKTMRLSRRLPVSWTLVPSSSAVRAARPGLGHRPVAEHRLAVPEQARVAVERGAVLLPSYCALSNGPAEHLLLAADVGELALLERRDPAGLAELGRPDDVHADEVDRGVLRRQAPDQLLALLVGVGRQALGLQDVGAARLGVAGLDDVGQPGLVADVPVDDRRAAGSGVAVAPQAARVPAPVLS
jgi:hypothetical protein